MARRPARIARHAGILGGLALASTLFARSARADEPVAPPAAAPVDPYAAFPLVVRHDKHYEIGRAHV